jgi:hypothetical protein
MKKLIALLEAASGLPKTALASCVNDDGSFNTEEYAKIESKIKEGIETKLENARKEAAKEATEANDGKGSFDDGFKRGEAKVSERFEKKLRDAFGVEEKLSGDELIKTIAANKDKAPKEITKDAVERMPWYQEEQETKEKAHKEELKKIKQEHEDFKGQVSRKERLSEMRRRATPLIEELNLNLSSDPARRQAQLEVIWEKLEAHDYDINDDRVMVLKDGKVLKDKMDNTIKFDEFVTGTATKFYDPKESKERESPGVKTPPKEGEKSKGWKGEVPKTKEDIERALVNDELPAEERMALLETLKGQ